MKILVVLSRFPFPLEKGDKLRAFHQLRILSEHHELYLVALCEKQPTEESLEKVRPFCKEMYVEKLSLFSRLCHTSAAALKGLPLQCGYFYNGRVKKLIDQVVARVNPDRIYCQMVRVAEYVKDIPVKKTIDYQDVLSKGMQRRSESAPFWSRPFFKSEARRLARYERDIFPLFNERVIITEVDRDLIPHEQSAQIHVVANGVEHDRYPLSAGPKVYDLIFSGNMSYAPNVEAAEYLAKELMPLLLNEFPELKLAICGANPSVKVRSLASPHVIVTGWVDDMAEYYAKSRIFIAPMHLGTGLQNKLLEAMSMKLPCITSPLASLPLKGVKDGNEILVCSTTTGYVEAVKFLLENPEKYAELAENGHNFVKQNYNWHTVNMKLSDIISR